MASSGDGTPRVYAWGANKYGQLGLTASKVIPEPTVVDIFDTLEQKVVQIASGDQHSIYLMETGEVIATGQNKNC